MWNDYTGKFTVGRFGDTEKRGAANVTKTCIGGTNYYVELILIPGCSL